MCAVLRPNNVPVRAPAIASGGWFSPGSLGQPHASRGAALAGLVQWQGFNGSYYMPRLPRQDVRLLGSPLGSPERARDADKGDAVDLRARFEGHPAQEAMGSLIGPQGERPARLGAIQTTGRPDSRWWTRHALPSTVFSASSHCAHPPAGPHPAQFSPGADEGGQAVSGLLRGPFASTTAAAGRDSEKKKGKSNRDKNGAVSGRVGGRGLP